MESPSPADELLDLTRALRAQIARHVAAGGWAAPGGTTARSVIVPYEVPVSDAPVDIYDDEALRPAGHVTLPMIRAEVGECTRCKLSKTRKSIVFGVGDPNAPLMFVGEAP
ncbi:MAG TPA: hypothetical protein VGC41_24275, partial [Kofleriaceae bacterium]